MAALAPLTRPANPPMPVGLVPVAVGLVLVPVGPVPVTAVGAPPDMIPAA